MNDLYLKLGYFLQVIDMIRWYFYMKLSSMVYIFFFVLSIFFYNKFAKFASQHKTISCTIYVYRCIVKLEIVLNFLCFFDDGFWDIDIMMCLKLVTKVKFNWYYR